MNLKLPLDKTHSSVSCLFKFINYVTNKFIESKINDISKEGSSG
jgi:hypothetical protein